MSSLPELYGECLIQDLKNLAENIKLIDVVPSNLENQIKILDQRLIELKDSIKESIPFIKPIEVEALELLPNVYHETSALKGFLSLRKILSIGGMIVFFRIGKKESIELILLNPYADNLKGIDLEVLKQYDSQIAEYNQFLKSGDRMKIKWQLIRDLQYLKQKYALQPEENKTDFLAREFQKAHYKISVRKVSAQAFTEPKPMVLIKDYIVGIEEFADAYGIQGILLVPNGRDGYRIVE